MATYPLQIVTPDRKVFSGDAESVIVRTVAGDACILAGHIDYAVPLSIGQAKVRLADGTERIAACNGGFLSVYNGAVHLAAITFEWSDEIDVDRAAQSREKAEKRLQAAQKGTADYALADAKLRRALARLSAGKH